MGICVVLYKNYSTVLYHTGCLTLEAPVQERICGAQVGGYRSIVIAYTLT